MQIQLPLQLAMKPIDLMYVMNNINLSVDSDKLPLKPFPMVVQPAPPQTYTDTKTMENVPKNN